MLLFEINATSVMYLLFKTSHAWWWEYFWCWREEAVSCVEVSLQLRTDAGSGYEGGWVSESSRRQNSGRWLVNWGQCSPLIGWIIVFCVAYLSWLKKEVFLVSTRQVKSKSLMLRNKVYEDNLLRFISTRADCFVRKLPENQLKNLQSLEEKSFINRYHGIYTLLFWDFSSFFCVGQIP